MINTGGQRAGRLLTGASLTAAVKAAVAEGPRAVAVAFIGPGAPKDMLALLSEDDILVCDAGVLALSSGSTYPSVLRDLLARKVKLWSRAGMHAKVYVGSQSAVVCSANLSGHALGGSTSGSIEAGVALTSGAAVTEPAGSSRNSPAVQPRFL